MGYRMRKLALCILMPHDNVVSEQSSVKDIIVYSCGISDIIVENYYDFLTFFTMQKHP